MQKEPVRAALRQAFAAAVFQPPSGRARPRMQALTDFLPDEASHTFRH